MIKIEAVENYFKTNKGDSDGDTTIQPKPL